MVKFGESLKYQREINGLTQSELSRKTNISQQNISKWEKEDGEPGILFCIRLADFYGITLDELVGRDYEKTSKINNTIHDNHGSITFNQR